MMSSDAGGDLTPREAGIEDEQRFAAGNPCSDVIKSEEHPAGAACDVLSANGSNICESDDDDIDVSGEDDEVDSSGIHRHLHT